MNQVTALPEPADSHIGAIVFVEYGHAYGLPKLILRATILEERVRKGVSEFLVRAEGKIEKWVTEAQVLGYDWTQPTIVTIEKVA